MSQIYPGKTGGERAPAGENMQVYEGVWTGPQSKHCGGAANGRGSVEARGSSPRVSTSGGNMGPFYWQEGGPKGFSGGARQQSDLFFRKILMAGLQRKARTGLSEPEARET